MTVTVEVHNEDGVLWGRLWSFPVSLQPATTSMS
jgi:hypothetical protein